MTAKLWMFLWRDWVNARSYRISFLLQNAALLAPLVVMYFLKRTFTGVEVPALAAYGSDYITFIFIGIIVTVYSYAALHAFSASLRGAQMTGTLEVLLLTRASLPEIILGWSLYPFARATAQLLIYLVAGFLVLGLAVSNANMVGSLLVFGLGVAVMAGLGVMAAAFTLVFKQGDPFTGLITAAAGLLSGSIFPASVLPGWLQPISQILPQTHFIEGMRLAMLQGSSLAELSPCLGPLLAMSALLPASLIVFDQAMRRAKVEGSLAHF